MLAVLTLGFVTEPLSAQSVWSGTADISWYDATQTSFDISTPEQLAGVATLMSSQATNFSGITLNLTADLWLNADNDSTNNWIPIGGYATASSEAQNNSSAYAFSGTFKGHGHTIYNLYCEKSSYYQAGLFGCVQYPCTIDSLVLVNPVVKARGMSGSLIGYTLNSGNVYVSHCIAINCRVEATGNNNNGGLLGANWQMQDGSNWTYFTNCAVTGHLSGKYIGGVVGNGQKVNTSNVYFAGSLSPVADGGINKYGGIIGHADNGKFNFTNTHSNITSTYTSGRDGTLQTEAYMQSAAFVNDLGTAFMADNGLNNGYPILSFMAGVSASATEICQGESVTLTGMGYDSYLWTPGNQTSQTITVSPTTTTTYTMTGTMSDGTTGTHSVTITVYPQAVVTATVTASSDGQVHGTVTPETATVGCGSSDNVTFTVTPDNGWRVASVYLNGTQVYDAQTYGPFTFTINPGGTLANVVINMTNALTCTNVTGLHASNIYGSNATVSWNAHTTGDLSEYHIIVYDLTNQTETEYTTTDLSYTIMGLTENTSYQVGVYTFCLDGYGSDTATVNFITPCYSPVSETFGSGTGSTQGNYFPLQTYYNYSYTQQILPATEFNNGAQDFSSMAFQYFYSTSYTRNIDIYLAHVPAGTDLSGGWITPAGTVDSAFTLVYSGNTAFNNSGADYWFEIPFDTMFSYNGTDNVLVAVLDHTGTYSNSSSKFYTHSDATTTNMSRYAYRDGSTYNPFGPDVAGTMSSYTSNMRLIFCDESTCIRPNTLTYSNLTDNSVDIAWVTVGTEAEWEVEYRTAADTEWTSFGSVYSNPATLSPLNSDTRYYVRVRAVCGSGEYSLWTEAISFRTACGPLTQLPYFNNFDEVISDNGTNFITCWSRLTTDPSRVVRCYGSSTHSGSYALDFNYSPSCTTAAVTPMLDASIPLNTVMLDFWAYSSLGQGWMEVGTMSDPTDFTTYEFYDTVRLSAAGTWENLMISFENYTGTNQYIAFLEINGTSTSYIFDDFTIDYIPVCLHPTNLSVDGLTNTTVTLSWDEMGTANAWTVEYGPAGFTPGSGSTVAAYEDSITVENLVSATIYDFYVYADCSGDLSDPFGPVSATPGQYIFGVTGSDTLTTCGMILYDNGGPNGDYSNNCNYTLVIYPETPGAMVALNGTLTSESISYDYLTIYDGVGTGTQLAKIGGTNQTVNVMSTTGPLTVNFHSDNSVVRSGFAVTVSCVTCYPASHLTASGVTDNSATVTWQGNGSSYTVYLYGNNDTVETTTTDTFMLFSNLNLNTDYTVQVLSICQDGDTATLSSAIQFTTTTIPATLPYSTDYEDANDNLQWGIVNGTQTNKWYIGAPSDTASDVNTTPGGANGLYVSNDGGASNTYTGSESRVYAFRDILIPDGTTELKLSFDWKAQGGNATNEFLRVYWIDPAVVTITAGNNPPSVGGVNYDLYGMPGYPTLGAHWLSQQSTWQHEEMLITADQFTGMGNGDHVYRLYFHWRNTSYSSNPPAAVDNVSLTVVTCTTPANVAVNNVTENSATVTWSGSADTYGVTILSADGTEDYQTTSDTFLVLSGLTSQTAYQVAVRGYCGGDSSMISQGVQFQTACGAITSLPYTENFNTYSSMGGSNFIDCWYRHTSDPSNHWVYVNAGSDAYSGGSLDFHYTPSCYTMAATPMFDPSISLSTLMIEGMTKIHLNGSGGVFEVGTMSDASDPTTFTPYDTIEYSATFTWLPFTILLNNYTGNDHYIAFRASNGNQVSFLLDDITIDVIPSCFHPSSPSVSNIGGTSATISWTGTTSDYVLEYGPAGFAEGTGTTVNVTNAMSYTLNGLDPTTHYTVYVYSDCGPDGISSGVSVSFQTDMVAVGLPYSTDFATDQAWLLNNGTCTNHWMMGTPSGDTQSALFVTNDNSSAGYTVSSNASTVMAEKLFTMPSTDSLHVEFDVRIGGETSWDYFKVFLTPSSEVFTAGTGHNTQSSNSYETNALNFGPYKSQTGYSSYPFMLNLTQGNTIHVSANIANPAVGGEGKLVFLWRNDGSSGTQPGAIVTNFSISVPGDTTQPTPPTVATNAATNIQQTTATLNATVTNPDNVTVTAKGFEWKTTAGGTYTPIAGTGTGNSFTADLTGLTASTGYTFKAFITYNGQTVYGNEMTFTTLNDDTPEPCATPTGLSATDAGADFIALAWDADPNVSSWNIQYRPQGGQLTSTASGSNSYTITGLEPETAYDIQVQADCGDGNTSEWSPAITVMTTTGIESWLENSVNLYPNPAKEYVDIRVDGDLSVTMMEVYDVYGKLVNTVNVVENPTRINVSSLANGMYFVRVTTEAGTVTKTFVKK